MATLVRDKQSGQTFVFLGAGYGAYKAKVGHFLFGVLGPATESDEIPMALVCDETGRVGWISTDDIQVVSVDGVDPGELLAPAG